MVKYRALTQEELRLMEKEFVEFLVVNGITAAEWTTIKEKDKDKAVKFTELFSDVVFEKMMRKTSYVTKRMGEILMSFYFGNEQANMILAEGWQVEKPLNELVKEDLQGKKLQLSSQSKSYQKTRESELFQLIQGGAEVSDGQLHKWLSNMLAGN